MGASIARVAIDPRILGPVPGVSGEIFEVGANDDAGVINLGVIQRAEQEQNVPLTPQEANSIYALMLSTSGMRSGPSLAPAPSKARTKVGPTAGRYRSSASSKERNAQFVFDPRLAPATSLRNRRVLRALLGRYGILNQIGNPSILRKPLKKSVEVRRTVVVNSEDFANYVFAMNGAFPTGTRLTAKQRQRMWDDIEEYTSPAPKPPVKKKKLSVKPQFPALTM